MNEIGLDEVFSCLLIQLNNKYFEVCKLFEHLDQPLEGSFVDTRAKSGCKKVSTC